MSAPNSNENKKGPVMAAIAALNNMIHPREQVTAESSTDTEHEDNGDHAVPEGRRKPPPPPPPTLAPRKPPGRASKDVAKVNIAEKRKDPPLPRPARPKSAKSQSSSLSPDKKKMKRSATAVTPAAAGVARSPDQVYELRVLSRIVPKSEEAALEIKVRRDYADLLEEKGSPALADARSFCNEARRQSNANFEHQFLRFLVFKEAFGHVLVPKIYPEEPALGRWVHRVRNWRNKGDGKITPERLARLDQAGFAWDAKASPDFWKVQHTSEQANESWEEMFQQLVDYQKQQGQLTVPRETTDNPRLARWIAKQRKHYRAKTQGKYNLLDDAKEAKLRELGFCFDPRTHENIRKSVLERFDGRWEEMFDRLVDFKKKHGHCVVPRRWKQDQPLASWVMRQRFHWKKMQLSGQPTITPERMQRLDDVGFAFVVPRKGDRDYEAERQRIFSGKGRLDAAAAAATVAVNASFLEAGADDDDAESTQTDNEEGREVRGGLLASPDNGSDAELMDSDDDEKVDGADDDEDDSHDESDRKPARKVARRGKAAKEASQIAEPETEPEPEPEPEPAPLLVKGIYVCKECGRDEFVDLMDAQSHEARCFSLASLALAADAILS